MDPIPSVLDEQFFSVASEECLISLAALVDDAMAIRLQTFLAAVPESNIAAQNIRKYLGDAIRSATFHLVLKERGTCQLIEKISLETLAGIRIDTTPIIEELEFVQENFQYVQAYLAPRKKTDYETFYALLPTQYKSKVAANKPVFFQPAARPRPTGASVIINRKETWTIALKGLKYRKYCAGAGLFMDGYALKEF